jgi:DNA-binding CsgD family transcriptional regulator
MTRTRTPADPTLRAIAILRKHPMTELRELARMYLMPIEVLQRTNRYYKLGAERKWGMSPEKRGKIRDYCLENPEEPSKSIALLFGITRVTVTKIKKENGIASLTVWTEKERRVRRAIRKVTGREFDVLRLIADGWANLNIAAHLNMSENSVKTHLKSIFDKTGVVTRTQLALLYQEYCHQQEIAELKGLNRATSPAPVFPSG